MGSLSLPEVLMLGLEPLPLIINEQCQVIGIGTMDQVEYYLALPCEEPIWMNDNKH